MRKSFYKYLIINMAVISAIVLLLSFYMISVVDNSSVRKSANKNFETIQKEIDSKQTEFDNILAQISDDNTAKAKAIAILLNQSPVTYFEPESLEELRVALNIEEILITDKDGIVVSGTAPYIGQNFNNNDIQKQFIPGLTDKSYSHVINDIKDGSIKQYVGVARIDTNGIVYIQANAYYLESAVNISGISTIAKNHIFLRSGEFSIINKQNWQYVSHTNESLTGKPVQISKSKFKNIDKPDGGSFKLNYQGNKILVFYRTYKDHVITAQIKTSDVYSRRNYVTVGIFLALGISAMTAFLAVRKKLIDYDLN